MTRNIYRIQAHDSRNKLIKEQEVSGNLDEYRSKEILMSINQQELIR